MKSAVVTSTMAGVIGGLAQLKFLSGRASADSQTRDWYRYYKKEYDFGSD